jgi:hypothetical protein
MDGGVVNKLNWNTCHQIQTPTGPTGVPVILRYIMINTYFVAVCYIDDITFRYFRGHGEGSQMTLTAVVTKDTTIVPATARTAPEEAKYKVHHVHSLRNILGGESTKITWSCNAKMHYCSTYS